MAVLALIAFVWSVWAFEQERQAGQGLLTSQQASTERYGTATRFELTKLVDDAAGIVPGRGQ